MLVDFVATAHQLVATATDRLDEDPAEARRAAHSLKSAARYAGALALGDAAEAVEGALADEQIEVARAAVALLRPSLDAVEQAVAALTLGQSLKEMRSEIGLIAAPAAGPGTVSEIGLEAVVGLTEEAASKILEAAEAIAARIERIGDGDEARVIQDQLTAIFEACSFQDLTSQRVRRAIARLTAIEEQLDGALRRFRGDSADDPADELATRLYEPKAQAEIDRLIADKADSHFI
ncbi:MAG: Hpt domain-containing protein [Alphaproteobacteria bacterium]|nr:Hpt domain-containing protein [Alphaproteobacteria bacterium]